MDLLERIKDTVPLYGVAIKEEGVNEVMDAMNETYKQLEALADNHALGFARWLYFNFREAPTPDNLTMYLEQFKKRHPHGY